MAGETSLLSQAGGVTNRDNQVDGETNLLKPAVGATNLLNQVAGGKSLVQRQVLASASQQHGAHHQLLVLLVGLAKPLPGARAARALKVSDKRLVKAVCGRALLYAGN